MGSSAASSEGVKDYIILADAREANNGTDLGKSKTR